VHGKDPEPPPEMVAEFDQQMAEVEHTLVDLMTIMNEAMRHHRRETVIVDIADQFNR
jgi:hypothetical protein